MFPDLSLETTVDELFGELIKPAGNWSIIFVAYPSLLPSLYIEMLYVTSSLSLTTTGSFLCLYVAVVAVCSVVSSIFGILVSFKFVPFNCVMYLRNAKSNSFGCASNSVGISFVALVTSTIGCSEFNSIASAVSVPSNHNVFFVVSCVVFIFIFTFSIPLLDTVI